MCAKVRGKIDSVSVLPVRKRAKIKATTQRERGPGERGGDKEREKERACTKVRGKIESVCVCVTCT